MEKNQDKGFTLVELLIVIVILGILATVTVFAVRGITDKGQANACDVESRTLETAVEAYYAQNQFDPEVVITLAADDPGTVGIDDTRGLVPEYLKQAPDTSKWTFYNVGDNVPASDGPDGLNGTADDRANVPAATNAGFYSVEGANPGLCAGF